MKKILVGFSAALCLFRVGLQAASIVLTEFEGLSRTESGRNVPDPHGAAGPQGVMQTVNTVISYSDKTGNRIWGPISLGTFGASAGNTGAGNADPKVIYDPKTSHFYVIMQENTTNQSFLNVAVSRTSHPATATGDSWFFFRLNMTQQADGKNLGGDYPGLGVDDRALYVTYNMFDLPIARGVGNFRHSQIIILDKADLNRGVLTFQRRSAPDLISFTLVPATVVGANSPGNKAYFAKVDFPISISLWTLEDPLGAATLSLPFPIAVPPNAILPLPGAPQLGTTNRVATMAGEFRAQGSAFWRDGSLWFCYSGGDPFNLEGRARVHYYRIDTETFPFPSLGVPNLEDPGFIDAGPDVWTFQPAIGGNKCGDVCLVFTASSASLFPLIMCAVRPRNATRFDPPFVVRDSISSFNSSCQNTDGAFCWGDYATVSVDPIDNSFWISHEWVRSAATNGWSTWWAQIAVTPPTPSHWFVNPEFCLIRTGARDCLAVPPSGPLERVRDGVRQAGYGDVVHIHGDNYDEPMTLNKCMTFRAYEGNAVIGR